MSGVIDFNDAKAGGWRRPDPRDNDHVRRIKDQLEARVETVLAMLLPGGVIAGDEFHVGDVQGNRGQSLKLSLRKGKLGVGEDFATGQKFGDLLDIWMAARNASFVEALRQADEWLGNPTAVAAASKNKVPRKKSDDLGAPTGTWHYRDAAGSIIATVYRYDREGGKEFRPWDARRQAWGAPDIRPLYNLPGILSAASVIVVEGEKCADVLIGKGYAATTAMQGSKAPAGKTDWTPLAGKHVVIWPDADEPGEHYAKAVEIEANKVGALSVRLIEISELAPKGWDAADAIQEGIDPAPIIGDLPVVDQQPTYGFPLVWFRDVEPSLDSNDFVEDLLIANTLSVVYGPSNCGKTFFALDVALHVATGQSWFGHEIDSGGVVYAALEGGHGIMNRIVAWRRAHKMDGVEVPFAVVPAKINLLDPRADVEPFAKLVKAAADHLACPARLIVIDTLARAFQGGNENASEDMGALVSNADRLRVETGAHVLFIHHSGKDEARGARGHSSLRAALDTEIEILKDEETDIATVTVTKQRDLATIQPFTFALKSHDLGTNRRGKPVTSCVIVPGGDAGSQQTKPKLRPRAREYLHQLHELLAREAQPNVVPEAGMSPVMAVRREQFRGWLVHRGVLFTEENGAISGSDRSAFKRVLDELRSARAIGMIGEWMWAI